jgi:K+-sensing histidine kinase KdpD
MRGRHKVFLGMAAGVGKTYRMLQEGHGEAESGRDVAIGYLEPHDRPETAALAAGLEVVPPRHRRGTASGCRTWIWTRCSRAGPRSR